MTVHPEGAVELRRDGRYLLAREGAVTITASHESPQGSWTGERTIEVSVPPLVVFDMEIEGVRNLYRMRLDGEDLLQLTSHPAGDSQPTVAGDWVVFVSARGGNPDLYRVPVGGGQVERLTTTDAVEAAPALAKDGSRLAWTSDASGVPRLWLGNGDASGAAPASGGSPEAVEMAPSWNSAGSRIAFASTALGVPNLYGLNVATGEVELLLPHTGSYRLRPRWNPSREEIVFLAEEDGASRIFLLEVADRVVHQISTGPLASADPGWLSDDRLVYVASLAEGTQLRWVHTDAPELIHVIPVPGSAPRNPVLLQ